MKTLQKEYRSLLYRIKKAQSLEHAILMIKIFDYYTDKGKHFWDWKKTPYLGVKK